MPDQPLAVRVGEGAAAGLVLFLSYWKLFRPAKEVAQTEVVREVQRLHQELRDEFEVYSTTMTRRVQVLEEAWKAGKRETRDALEEMREIQLNTTASFESALSRFERRLMALLPTKPDPGNNAGDMHPKL